MSVKLNTRQVGDVAWWTWRGGSRWAKAPARCATPCATWSSKNQKKILLNLGEVNYIDSSGIGELVSGFTTVTNSGGTVEAAQPQQAGERSAADHQAVHRLRCPRRRSGRDPQLLSSAVATDGHGMPDRRRVPRLSPVTLRPTNCTISSCAPARRTVSAPVRLLDDPAVQFDGHAGRVQLQLLQQIQIVCPSRAVRGSPLTTISIMLG